MIKINPNTIKQDHYYTYEEFQTIDDGNRYELHNGELYMMSSPSSVHQAISVELTVQLGTFLRGKPCVVYHALDVRLNKNEDTVFIPDTIVVCEKSKIVKRGCEGVPDFIIEIVSPSNAFRDYLIKYREYLRAGVNEYWIIDPEHRKIFVNILEDGNYKLSQLTFYEPVAVYSLPGCIINFNAIFEAKKNLLEEVEFMGRASQTELIEDMGFPQEWENRGIDKGIEKTLNIIKMLKDNIPPDKIAEEIKLPMEKVMAIKSSL